MDLSDMPIEEPRWLDGDVYINQSGDIRIWCDDCEDEYGEQNTTHLIWLPRQDQLQEMLEDKYSNLDKLVEAFWNAFAWFTKHEGASFYPPEWAFNNNFPPEQNWIKFTSMEQLWLAFVMSEKFNKYWNGDNWVESKRLNTGKQ
jgi:hypothetical protein